MTAKMPSFLYSTFDKFMSSLSIRYILPLMIVTPLLASVTTIMWFSFQSAKQEIDSLILQVNEKSTKIIEKNIDNYLEKTEISLRSQVATLQRENLNLNNLPEVQLHFWQILQQKGSLDVIYLGNPQGNYVLVRKTGTQFIAAVRDKSTGDSRNLYELDSQGNRTKLVKRTVFDPRTRPWYRVAKNTEKPVWSPVYNIRSDNYIGMSFAIPLYNQKSRSFLGVVSTDFTLTEISSFLHNLEISSNGKAVILERTGNIIAESALEQPVKIVKQELKRLNVKESQEPLIQATGQYLIKKFNGLDRIEGKQQLTFAFRGKSQFVQVTPMQNQQGIDWLMVVVIPESDFMKHIYSYTRFTLIMGISVTGVAVILSLLLVRWIIQPIQQLQQAAKMLELEEFNEVILQEVASRKDEFGQLGKVFLAMSHIIYSREKNREQMIITLQKDKLYNKKIKSSDPYKKQVEKLEELLMEAQKVRTKIGNNTDILPLSNSSFYQETSYKNKINDNTDN